MQIFALNNEGEAIEAAKALKKVDYTCLECGAQLRVRRSPLLVAHYYHYQSSSSCSQKNKTIAHLNLQLKLQSLLNAKMEVPFPQISRIADIVHGNTVFEIQVSPISNVELEARIRDYQSLGMNIVWILHDRTFNQTFVSQAETSLHQHPHYFTDGMAIYDQISLIHKRQRLRRLFRRNIDITKPRENAEPRFKRSWKIGFENDVLNSQFLNPLEVQAFEEFHKPKRTFHFLLNVWRYFLLKASN